MEVVIVASPEVGAGMVVDAVAGLLRRRPDAVLGLATGSSPEPVYRELGHRYELGLIDMSAVSAFLLDEYVGLAPDHPASYRHVIRRQVVERLAMKPERVLGPDGDAEDLERACRDYESAISAAGGVDLQLLGIGTDGHIGFNEPGSSLGSRTRIKTLTSQTRSDNARFFGGRASDVPSHVLTQGIGTISEARHLVLLAWGESKADAVARCVEGPLSASVPASALQLHPHATIIVDKAAAVALSRRDYYADVFASKPPWQGI